MSTTIVTLGIFAFHLPRLPHALDILHARGFRQRFHHVTCLAFIPTCDHQLGFLHLFKQLKNTEEDLLVGEAHCFTAVNIRSVEKQLLKGLAMIHLSSGRACVHSKTSRWTRRVANCFRGAWYRSVSNANVLHIAVNINKVRLRSQVTISALLFDY